MDWKMQHRRQCEKLKQVFTPPTKKERAAAAAAAAGSNNAAAAAGGGGGSTAAPPDGGGEDDHLCPICLDNKDDFAGTGYINLRKVGKEVIRSREATTMCFTCGQMFCGPCSVELDMYELYILHWRNDICYLFNL